jgi:hypothetical protein
MSKTCGACLHPDVTGINAAIASGTSNRAIACQWQIGRMTVQRHRHTCLREPLEAVRAEQFSETLDLLKTASRRAIKTLKRHLDAPETPASVQVRAAAIILEQAVTIHRLSELEERVAELKHMVEQSYGKREGPSWTTRP